MFKYNLNIISLEELRNSAYDLITRFFQWSYDDKCEPGIEVGPGQASLGSMQAEWNLDQGLIDIYARDINIIINRLIPSYLFNGLKRFHRLALLYLVMDDTGDEYSDNKELVQRLPDHLSNSRIYFDNSASRNEISNLVDFREWIKRGVFIFQLFSMAGLRMILYIPFHLYLFHLFQTLFQRRIITIRGPDRIKLKPSCLFHKRN